MNADLESMAARREPCYARIQDMTVSNDESPDRTVRTILEAIK